MSGKSEADPTLSLFVILAFFGIAAWIVWSMFQPQILDGMRYVRYAELYIISFFTQEHLGCLAWLRDAQTGTNVPTAAAWREAVACFGADTLQKMQPPEALNYYNLSPESLGIVTDRIAVYMRWPAVLICAAMAIYSLFIAKHNKFKTSYTLETFIQVQAKMWPVISPIVKFNPAKTSARMPGDPVPDVIPLFAEAFSPEEWVAYNRIAVVNGIPDRESTRRAFQQQLGPRWKGFDGLPLYILCLLAAFALKGTQKREEADDMLGRIAVCWSVEKGMVVEPKLQAEIMKILADPEVGGKALEIAGKYAYRTTAVLGVLKWARFMGGVLAPGQFVWLRAVDRALWYPLNNLARRSFHSEGAGALAHFMAEEAAQKPLVIARVETAIVTLNQYLGRSPVKIPKREEPKTINAKKR